MPFDAADLFWPPFRSLYDRLEAIKLEPEAVEAASLKSSLQEYSSWLAKGLGGFKKPNDTSRKALDTESHLSVGSQKLPVETGLRSAALATSRALNLDEVQAYILLRRWYRQAAGNSFSTAAGTLLVDGQISPSQLRDVAVLYSQERLCLLQSLEDLLWLGEGASGEGPFGDAVEETLVALVDASPGLEEVTIQSLKENLEGPSSSVSSSSSSSVSYASNRSVVAALSEEEEGAPERNVMLTILMLIYFHPRKQCTPVRFLELARLFHTRLFTQPQYLDWGRAKGVAQPALLSVKLATLLLLEVLALDVEKPLEVLAQGGEVTHDAITFLAPDIQGQVDSELRSWWPASRPAHAPIFLVWSALQTLGKRPGAEQHATRAYESGVLSALCQLSSAHGLHPSATEMAGTIVFSAMGAVFAAFGLEPLTMPVPDTEAVVEVLSNVFQGQNRLCSSFWQDEDAPLNRTVRHFLDSLAHMYPALPEPLLRLLCALSSGPDAAAAANAYLACLPRLTCLHVLPDPAIGAHSEDPGVVVTEQPLSLPGAQSLTFPAGIVGEIVDTPPDFPGTWTAGPGASLESLHLIRWRLTVPDGTAQWVLLCRGFEALRAVQAWQSVAALKELDAALSLLAAVCVGDPATAMELLHVEAPVAESVAAEGARGPDILLFAGQAVAVLAAALSAGPHGDRSASSALAHALRLFSALAPDVPGRVADELIAALGITPLAVSLAVQVPGASQEATLLRAVVAAEGAAGEYPATLALLQLLSTLLQAGRPSPGLAPLVAFVAQRIMPELQHWKFSRRAQRWQLATACLSVTRHALLVDSDVIAEGDTSSSAGSSSLSSLSAAVVSTLRTDAGTSACLLPLLPPEAPALEAAAQNRQASEEVEAAEKCCVAWLRLIPVLLPPASPNTALSAEPFLRGRADGGRPPAATLLSFLVYPYFGTRERALVVRSVHSFAVAAATAAPDVPLVALLPQGIVGVTPAVKAVFEQAITPAAAHASHSLFGAACDVLIAALRHHPSMLDALMFPAHMETTSGKENKSDTNGAAIVQHQHKKGKAAHSCLDDLWSLLQRVEQLAATQPYVAAKALQVVAAMWQSGGPATRAMLLLRQQEGFWKAIIRVVESAAAAGPLQVPAVTDDGQAESWSRLDKDCWRVAAEAYAVQIIAAEWYMWASAGGGDNSSSSGAGGKELLHQQQSGGGGGGGAPAEVVEFAHNSAAATIPGLLRRYCSVLPSASLLKDTHRVAAAAGLQLLSTAVQDSALWATLQAGTSFVPSLAAAAQAAVGAFDSSTDAAAGLARRSSELLSLGGQMRGRAMHAVADSMLSLAEVSGRVASDQEYGKGFAFDTTAFIRRVGSALAHACPTVMDLQSWLAAASVAASLEDACLAGAAAVDAFVSIIDGQLQTQVVPGRARFAPSDTDVNSALDVLSSAVESVAQEALAKVQNEAEGGCAAPAIEVSGVHIAGLASAAQVCLVMLSRHVPKDAPAAAALCCRTLHLTGAWLTAERAAKTEDPEASSRISLALLAAALHSVSAVSVLSDSTTQESNSQDVSRAAQHILPSLLRVMSEGGHLSVPSTSLAAGILDKILPSSVWLPIFERGIHMGAFLTRVLDDVGSSKSSGGAAGGGGDTEAMNIDYTSSKPATTATAGSSTAQESAMLLALQVAQIPAGAALLVEQGVLQLAVALCSWLQAPSPGGGNLLGECIAASVDYSNAYTSDGTPNHVHRLWCSTLALVGLLAAALPGHAAAEGAAMQVAIGMDARLLLALEPPEGSKKQPLTLAMAQEAKYALFLLRGVARSDGEWRLALPHALPAMRRASASLLRFAAEALDDGNLVCGPVSLAERASAKAKPPSSPLGGWFQRCVDACGAHGVADSGNNPVRANGTTPSSSAYGWEMAERLASCVQYALAFQLETAPEVSEAEVATLGPEWVDPGVVRALAAGFQDVVAGVSGATARGSPAGKRVLRTCAAVLKTCLQLLDMMSVRLGAAARQELLEDILAAEQV